MNAPAERPLFISQDKLVQWESEGKVNLSGTLLTLVAEKRTYELTEAVRFMKALGDEPPGHSLVGKVRTKEQLKAMNAEHYMGSVILGDLGYEVQEGFVGMVALRPQHEAVLAFGAPITSVGVPQPPASAAAPAVVSAAPRPLPAPSIPTPPVMPAVTPPPPSRAPAPVTAVMQAVRGPMDVPKTDPALRVAPPMPPPPPAAAPTPPPAQNLASSIAKAAGDKAQDRSDAEMLADFLLANLNG